MNALTQVSRIARAVALAAVTPDHPDHDPPAALRAIAAYYQRINGLDAPPAGEWCAGCSPCHTPFQAQLHKKTIAHVASNHGVPVASLHRVDAAIEVMASTPRTLTPTSELYDFCDGHGPVPAHRHPNGGGWVADTAYVSDIAHVEPDAVVAHRAQVLENAKILDHATIQDDAIVYGPAIVRDYSCVRDEARLSGNIQLNGFSHLAGKIALSGEAVLRDFDIEGVGTVSIG